MPLRRLWLALMLVILGLTAAACDNTIRGIRRDIEDTGDAVSGS